MAGPGRGFENLKRKGFCSPPPIPQRLAGVGLLGPTAFLSPLSNSTNNFLFLPRPDGGLAGPVVVPQGPGSHASPPFDGQLWRSLPRSQDLASPAVYICSQAWLPLPPWEERSVPMLCASRPAAHWLRGLEAVQVLAGRLMSECHWRLNVYLCPFHYKKPHLWLSPHHPPRQSSFFLQKQLCLKAAAEASGSFRYWVLVQDPCPGSWLGEDLPPTANGSCGCFSWSASASSQDR